MKIRALSQSLQEKAEKELNEIPSKTEECLEILRNWLAKQPHLKYKNDDQLLVNFLRCCKYNMERTKEKLDAYYTFRTIAPEISNDLDPLSPSMQFLLSHVWITVLPLPKDNPASEVFAICKYGDIDFDGYTPAQLIKVFFLTLETSFNADDNFIVSGVKLIWDFKNMPYKIIVKVTPKLVTTMVHCVQHAYPIRIKGIYCINVPGFCEPVVSLIKYIAPKKIAKRVHFYTTSKLEVIHEEIPKSILPTEYGGDAGPLDKLYAKSRKNVENGRERLLEEDRYYSDESKRSVPSNYTEYLFGVDGTFRKLEID